jgi:hypothetical protein
MRNNFLGIKTSNEKEKKEYDIKKIDHPNTGSDGCWKQ